MIQFFLFKSLFLFVDSDTLATYTLQSFGTGNHIQFVSESLQLSFSVCMEYSSHSNFLNLWMLTRNMNACRLTCSVCLFDKNL